MLAIEVHSRHCIYTYREPFVPDSKDRCVRFGRLEAHYECGDKWIIRFFPQNKLLEAGRYVLHADWQGPPRRFTFTLKHDMPAVRLEIPGKSTKLRSIQLTGCYLERFPL